jgi:hypothetical protein
MNADVIESPFAARAVATQQDSAGSRQNQSRELAETQTKYLMAERFPRDEVAAMDRILNAFSRPTLAEKAAYQFARGGSDIAGPSIRAAEAIAQQWGNMDSGWRELQRGIDAAGVPFSEVEAFCVDLQSRNSKRLQFIVRHWRDTKQGGYKLKDERDIYELCANQAQRRLRACILASVPGDVTEAAMQQADVTLKSKADTSPEAMHKMCDAFQAFGVTKEHIEKRIQRRLDAIQPAQVVSLKRIYASLRDDMSAPSDWFDIEPEAPKSSAIDAVKAATAARKTPAAKKPATKTLYQFKDEISNATAKETAALVIDEARDVLTPDEHVELVHHFTVGWAE